MNVPDPAQTVAIEDPQKVQTLSASLSAMKADNESEAQRMVAAAAKAQPKTLADACLAMKDENLIEAQRLVPKHIAGKTPQSDR